MMHEADDSSLCFIDGPIKVFIRGNAPGEEILRAWARIERYVKVAAVQIDHRSPEKWVCQPQGTWVKVDAP